MTNTSCSIGFLTPYHKQNRGNATTAKRIEAGLQAKGISVETFAYEEEEWTGETKRRLEGCTLFHILHFYRFVNWAEQAKYTVNLPYIITSGGTDVNQHLFENRHGERMRRFIQGAGAMTVFSEDGKQKVENVLQPRHGKVHVVPQSVWLPDGDVSSVTGKRTPGYPNLLLPAGLRPVKDVLYLLDELVYLQKIYPHLQITFLGPVLDEHVHRQVRQAAMKYEWIHYAGEVPFSEMKAWYEWADVVLNTSVSEGQSSALLEGMALRKLVIVRDNPGNTSVVTNGKNGFLFANGEEFIRKMERWLNSPSLRTRIAENAVAYIEKYHSLDKEIDAYLELYKQALH